MRFFGNLSSVQGLALVIVIAWALFAVFMLTQTTVSASQIDRRVDTIVNEVSAIDTDTDAISLTQSINERASGILTAAEPLDGQLDQVIGSTVSIDKTAVSILDTAGSINSTVNSISGTANSINGTVDSINGRLSGVLDVATSINNGVQGINERADRVIGLSTGIKSDLDNVLTQVKSIDFHANSIDCETILVVLGCAG